MDVPVCPWRINLMKKDSLKRKDIAKILAERNPDFPREDIEEMVTLIFQAMTDALARGCRIEIRGFGNFSVHTQKGREFINPKTGKPTRCEQSRRIVFRAGKNLVDVEQ